MSRTFLRLKLQSATISIENKEIVLPQIVLEIENVRHVPIEDALQRIGILNQVVNNEGLWLPREDEALEVPQSHILPNFELLLFEAASLQRYIGLHDNSESPMLCPKLNLTLKHWLKSDVFDEAW